MAIHPPEIGVCEGGIELEFPLDLTVVVNVSVVVTVAVPGVSVVCENDAVVSGGRFEAEKVTALGESTGSRSELNRGRNRRARRFWSRRSRNRERE